MISSNATDGQTVIVTSDVAFVTFKASKWGLLFTIFSDVYMMLSATQSTFGPWVLLPDRLPFVRAALRGASECRRQTLPQALVKATANAVPRQASNSVVAVLPFYGVAVQRTGASGEALGLLSLWHFTKAFRAALADDSVSTLVIDVDSPGGNIFGVMELADEIYRSRARKHIVAIANSLAASGAYWIASAANELYLTPGGEVGGIGVYDIHTDLSKGFEKAGVATTLISAGKYKTEGNPFHPLGADARAAMQKRVDGYYRAFVAAVAKHRAMPELGVRNGMGQGRLLDAERAKDENMVDGIATLDDVVSKLARCIRHGEPVQRAASAAQLQARRRVIQALNHRPPCKESCPTGLAARSRREIELLSL